MTMIVYVNVMQSIGIIFGINTLRPEQNGRHFEYDTNKYTPWKENLL